MTVLHYFGYGSNMDPRTFLGRRRMRPVETRIARLADYELCFELPVGDGERGVANIRRLPGSHVWGVVYGLVETEFDRLDRTEGVHRGYYRRVPIEVDLEGNRSETVFTYESSYGVPGRKPSPRYMGLLLHGARQNGLPAEYVSYLRGIPLAHDERDTQRELFPR